jgi:transposase InsO family protein
VGVLPMAPGGFRYLFVGVDTFTKWMKVVPTVNITQDAAVKFLQSIIYRFGMPIRILTDNGTQFKGAKFARCCVEFGIQHQPSSMVHAQINGQVERTNGLILQRMKNRIFHDLEVTDRNWHKELPSVLWSLRTNVNQATRYMPFNLLYGADVILSCEIYLQSARVTYFDSKHQAETRELDSILLEERHNTALINVQK